MYLLLLHVVGLRLDTSEMRAGQVRREQYIHFNYRLTRQRQKTHILTTNAFKTRRHSKIPYVLNKLCSGPECCSACLERVTLSNDAPCQKLWQNGIWEPCRCCNFEKNLSEFSSSAEFLQGNVCCTNICFPAIITFQRCSLCELQLPPILFKVPPTSWEIWNQQHWWKGS